MAIYNNGVAAAGFNVLTDLASASAIPIKPTGDTDDYLTLSTVSNVPSIFGTGAYVRIGDAAATSHALASEDDLMVSGKLEVDGVGYIDNSLYVTGDISLNNDKILYLGTLSTAGIIFETGDFNAKHIQLLLPDGGAQDVPVVELLTSVSWNIEHGLFDGITQPLLVTIEKGGQLHTATDGIADAGAATAILKHVGGFTAAVVGDIVRITAGTLCTVGWYWITTVTSADQVTLDRNYASNNTTNVTFVTFHNFPMIGADGVCLKCFDGAPADSNTEIDRDGWLMLDVGQANVRVYWCSGNAWQYVDATE